LVPQKRRAQNRASQRAYRERKDQRIRDLESQVQEGNKQYRKLLDAYMALSGKCQGLTAMAFESAFLRAAHLE